VEKKGRKVESEEEDDDMDSLGDDDEEMGEDEYDDEEDGEDEGSDVSSEGEEQGDEEKGKDVKDGYDTPENADEYLQYGSEDDSDEDGEKSYDDSSSDDSTSRKKKKKKGGPKEIVIKEIPADPYLIRREATLLNMVLRHFKKRVIVFFNEKIQCHRMLILFKIFGLKAAQVQGNLTQGERMQAIEAFQKGDVDFLLATDLVARGLDIPNVKTVINFSFPNEPKRYLHRIGRTARAGMHGVALTLCNDAERTDIKKLTRKLGHQINPYTLQQKQVQTLFDLLLTKLDKFVKDLQIEEAGD
jgi:superfamily II DNA or RNA helicase